MPETPAPYRHRRAQRGRPAPPPRRPLPRQEPHARGARTQYQPGTVERPAQTLLAPPWSGRSRCPTCPVCGSAGASAPRSPSRRTRRSRTCSSGTSPRPARTSPTSGASPTCRLRAAATCTSRPSSTATARAWRAGPSPTTYPPTASLPPSTTLSRLAGAWPARSSTPTTAPTRPPTPSPSSAPNSASRSRWARSSAAPTRPSPSRSTPPLSASTCRALRPGPTSCPAAATCSAGPPAQHPPAPLLVRPSSPEHLRSAADRYAPERRLTINRVSKIKGQGPVVSGCLPKPRHPGA